MRDIGFRAGEGEAGWVWRGRGRRRAGRPRKAGFAAFRGAGGAEAWLRALRLDKFLWFARIVKTRALAQELAEKGRIRLDGRVVDRAHAPVRVGDVLSFAQRGAVRVLEVEALPARRGPPAEARALYSRIDERSRRGLGTASGEREKP